MSVECSDMDTIHGALLNAHASGMTLSDVLAVLDAMPEINNASDFDAAVDAAVNLRGVT